MIEYILIVFTAFGGFFLASYLFHKKHEKKEHFICPLKGNCSEVMNSDFSTFMGVPVINVGLLYYAGIAIGYGLLVAFPEMFASLKVYLLAISSLAFLFSMYLTFIQLVVLRRICTWCLLSASFCTIIVILAIFGSLDLLVPFLAGQHDVILGFHLLAMGLGLGAATLTDVLFFKFLKDFRISQKESDVLSTVSEFIWVSLGVALVSGLALYLPEAAMLNESSKFILKVLVVMVIIANGAFLNLLITPRLVKISFGQEHGHKDGELVRTRKLAFFLGPISIVSWYSAFTLGFIAIDPSRGFQELLGYYVLALIVSVVIGQLFERHLTKEANH